MFPAMQKPLSQGAPQAFLASARPDFRQIEHWIFDLDNTLYAADATLMVELEARICRFVQRELGLDESGAWAVQKTYFRTYGTTLAGLMRHHGTDPEAYLSYVNDEVEVSSLVPDPQLVAGLERLPGKRFVLTNNCGRYGERVLKQLGIAHLFADIWDVRRSEFQPKPQRAAYDTLIRHANIVGPSAAMFDDLAANLEPARALGMTTVWLRKPNDGAMPARHVDHATEDLARFLQTIEVANAT
jgi:putative hydrolase of the HAD superfamily